MTRELNNGDEFMVGTRESFQETAATAGAKVSDYGIIETFNNDDEALDAAHNGVVVRF